MIDESAITFAGGTRDRADALRTKPERIARFAAAPASRVLPLWRGKPLFDIGDGGGAGGGPTLGWLPMDAPLADEGRETPVFLGREGDAGRFTLDVSSWIDPQAPDGPPPTFLDPTRNAHPSLPESRKFIDLRSIMGELTVADAADAATAKGVLEWHRTHRFCARCGQPSTMDGAGWRRRCPACETMHFPRTDPVVIMLITHGDRALIGRQPFWPDGMYSLLAGFMEPGETIEAAVRRETMEEAGVPVGRVRYLASQPWPFPASLMMGCAGEALSDDITIDPSELEDAIWVTKEDILASIAGRHPRLAAARKGAIARSVLEAWATGGVAAFD